MVSDITRITAMGIKPIHQRHVFTVVTDNCHSKAFLVSHVTVYFERFYSTLSVWVDDVRATFCHRIAVFDITAGSS